MSAKHQRDLVSTLAKSNPEKALKQARCIQDPWYRAQALSWVARYTEGDPVSIAKEAARAALEGEDNYRKSAVRAWEIAALAERGLSEEAGKRLLEAISLARRSDYVINNSGLNLGYFVVDYD